MSKTKEIRDALNQIEGIVVLRVWETYDVRHGDQLLSKIRHDDGVQPWFIVCQSDEPDYVDLHQEQARNYAKRKKRR